MNSPPLFFPGPVVHQIDSDSDSVRSGDMPVNHKRELSAGLRMDQEQEQDHDQEEGGRRRDRSMSGASEPKTVTRSSTAGSAIDSDQDSAVTREDRPDVQAVGLAHEDGVQGEVSDEFDDDEEHYHAHTKKSIMQLQQVRERREHHHQQQEDQDQEEEDQDALEAELGQDQSDLRLVQPPETEERNQEGEMEDQIEADLEVIPMVQDDDDQEEEEGEPSLDAETGQSFKCKACGYIAVDWYAWLAHQKKKHTRHVIAFAHDGPKQIVRLTPEGVFRCPRCPFRTPDKMQIRQHMKKALPAHKLSQTILKAIYSTEDESFPTKPVISRTALLLATYNGSKFMMQITRAHDPVDVNPDADYLCPVSDCDRTFSTYSAIRNHYKSVHKNHPVQVFYRLQNQQYSALAAQDERRRWISKCECDIKGSKHLDYLLAHYSDNCVIWTGHPPFDQGKPTKKVVDPRPTISEPVTPNSTSKSSQARSRAKVAPVEEKAPVSSKSSRPSRSAKPAPTNKRARDDDPDSILPSQIREDLPSQRSKKTTSARSAPSRTSSAEHVEKPSRISNLSVKATDKNTSAQDFPASYELKRPAFVPSNENIWKRKEPARFSFGSEPSTTLQSLIITLDRLRCNSSALSEIRDKIEHLHLAFDASDSQADRKEISAWATMYLPFLEDYNTLPLVFEDQSDLMMSRMRLLAINSAPIAV